MSSHLLDLIVAFIETLLCDVMNEPVQASWISSYWHLWASTWELGDETDTEKPQWKAPPALSLIIENTFTNGVRSQGLCCVLWLSLWNVLVLWKSLTCDGVLWGNGPSHCHDIISAVGAAAHLCTRRALGGSKLQGMSLGWKSVVFCSS